MHSPGRGFTATDTMLFLMATIWAVNFSVVKFATQIFTPLAFTGLRVAMASVVLIAIAIVSKSPWPGRRDILILLGIGVLGHGVYQLLFVEGLSRTRAGHAALIVAAAPAFIVVASRIRGIERVKRKMLIGIALSVVGVGLILSDSAHGAAGEATLTGSLLMVAAVLTWTTFTVLLQPYTLLFSPLKLSAITMVGGLVPLLVVSGPALAATEWAAVPMSAWAAVFYASILSMVVAYLFWYRGIKLLGPTRTSVYSNIQPVIALGIAWIFLSEIPTPWQAIGAGTIITGVLFTRA
ncbi:MAG: DMT family transporter [Gemmatimonadaceae bacterium]|nr:DMT family transporter [Gemmatimonadaceae bacterium]